MVGVVLADVGEADSEDVAGIILVAEEEENDGRFLLKLYQLSLGTLFFYKLHCKIVFK